jgi:hypothetical protein
MQRNCKRRATRPLVGFGVLGETAGREGDGDPGGEGGGRLSWAVSRA